MSQFGWYGRFLDLKMVNKIYQYKLTVYDLNDNLDQFKQISQNHPETPK